MVPGLAVAFGLLALGLSTGDPLVHEIVVEAPSDEVWRAFTVEEEIETWMVPSAEIDLRVGGTLRTAYDAAADLGGPAAIHHEILAFEPGRMLAMRVRKAPADFEFADLIVSTWNVFSFEALGATRTRVRSVGLGYGEGERWDRMRAFFERGNQWTLEQLRAKFASARTMADAECAAVLSLLHSMAEGVWVHEGKSPEGRPLRVQNDVEIAADGESLVATGWQDRGDGVVLHSNMQIWRDPEAGEVRFQNIGEHGDLSRGRITRADAGAGAATLLWHWERLDAGAGAPSLLLETTLSDDRAGYRLKLFGLAGAERRELASIDFTRRAGGGAAMDSGLSLYLAQVAAANAALRLEEVAEARRWLEETPAERRGWEWRYLDSRTDTSRWSIAAAPGSSISSVAFSPDGERIALAAEETVKVFSAADGAPLATLAGHEGLVYDVAFSPAGATLASSGRDRTIRLWDTDTFQQTGLLRDSDSHIMGLAFDPSGTRLAGTLLSYVKIWNLETLEPERTLAGHVEKPPVVGVAWRGDGARLASASWDNWVIVWDAASGRVLERLGPGYGGAEYVQFKSVEFSPDGARLLAAGSDGRWRLWDASTGAVVALVDGHAKDCLAATYHPDGARLATCGQDGLVRLWDSRTQALLATLRGHTAPVRALAFSPDGATLASGDDGGTIRFWSPAPEAYTDSFQAHEKGPWGIAWTPDGERLLTGSSDGLLKVWDAKTRRLIRAVEGHTDQVASVACGPDGRRALSGANDGRARVWDIETGEMLFESAELGAQVWDVEWGPDGRTFAASTNGKGFRVWDAATHKELLAVTDRRSRRIAYRTGGRVLAETDAEGRARLWDLATLAVAREFDVNPGAPLDECAFSPDGRLLALCGGDHTVRLWDIAAAGEVHVLRGHAGEVYDVAFLADGTRLATAAYDRSVRLWDVASARCTLTLPSATDVWTLAVSPDGSTVAWCPADGSVILSRAQRP